MSMTSVSWIDATYTVRNPTSTGGVELLPRWCLVSYLLYFTPEPDTNRNGILCLTSYWASGGHQSRVFQLQSVFACILSNSLGYIDISVCFHRCCTKMYSPLRGSIQFYSVLFRRANIHVTGWWLLTSLKEQESESCRLQNDSRSPLKMASYFPAKWMWLVSKRPPG